MFKSLLSIYLIFAILKLSNGAGSSETSGENQIVSARLESCPGCSLNRLTDVKKFAYEDLPKYENVEFKKISGAPPELLFLNKVGDEVERHSLKTLNREQCNKLLQSRGFKIKVGESKIEL